MSSAQTDPPAATAPDRDPNRHPDRVLRCGALAPAALDALVAGCGMRLQRVAAGSPIPGSHWGDDEAGLIGNDLYIRDDTPVHSLLHELCHWICMDRERRERLHTDAGGCDTEENAVCYLQVLLADELPGYSSVRLFADMDDWGYHFILGSARAWFECDADDALHWLQRHALLDPAGRFVRRARDAAPGIE